METKVDTTKWKCNTVNTFIYSSYFSKKSIEILPVIVSWSFRLVFTRVCFWLRASVTKTSWKKRITQTFRISNFSQTFESIFVKALQHCYTQIFSFCSFISLQSWVFIRFLASLPLRRRSFCLHSTVNMADFWKKSRCQG